MFRFLFLLASTCCVAGAVPRPTSAQDADNWFRFEPKDTPQPGAIGMADWLEKPAGKHGRVQRHEDA